jgi:predicted deacylase
VEGRGILLAQFGRGSRRVLFVGGAHGDEWGTGVASELARYLGEHPEAVPAGWRADVLLCANPDGLAHGTRGNARGVDLNRNLPSPDWRPGTEAGLSHGASAGSEPETQVLLRVLSARYTRVISLHSEGPLMDPDGPGALALARRMGRMAGYPVGDVANDADIHGSLGRYVPWAYGAPVVTVELGGPPLTPAMRGGLLAALR